MFCMNCGTKLPDEAKFCFKCGEKTIVNINSNEFSASVTSSGVEHSCNVVADKDNVEAAPLLATNAKERQEEQERLERAEKENIERQKCEAAARERQRLEAEQRYRSPEETKKRIENVVIKTMSGFVNDYIFEAGKEDSENTTFYLGNINESKLNGARRKYIKPKSIKNEEVFFLYDDTLMGDGKEGFALTPYGLTSSRFYKCIPYHFIEKVLLGEGFVKDIFVKLKSGSIIEFSGISKCESKIVKLLNEIIHNSECIIDSELLISSIGKDDDNRKDILFLIDDEPIESEEAIEKKKNSINETVRKYYRFVSGSLNPDIKDEDIRKVIQSYGAGLRLNKKNIIYLSKNCDFAITPVGLASEATTELIRFSEIKEIIFNDDSNEIIIEKSNGDIIVFGNFYRGSAVGRMLEELQCIINHKEYKDEVKEFDKSATLADIIKEVIAHHRYKFEQWFYLFPNIPEKKINNVLKSYAQNSSLRGENIFLLYDRTLIGSAKDGYVITEKGLVSSEHKELIPFRMISKAYRNDGGDKIYLRLIDGSDCYFAYNRVVPSLSRDVVDIINKIIKIAMQSGLFNANVDYSEVMECERGKEKELKDNSLEVLRQKDDNKTDETVVNGENETAVNGENEADEVAEVANLSSNKTKGFLKSVLRGAASVSTKIASTALDEMAKNCVEKSGEYYNKLEANRGRMSKEEYENNLEQINNTLSWSKARLAKKRR